MSVNKRTRNTLSLNRWHVAGDTFAARTAMLVVSVLFERSRLRTVRRRRAVAVQTNLIGRLPQLRIVRRPVDIVTRGACDSVSIHHALHEVVPLHPILVRRAVREVIERRLAQGAIFQPPEVLQLRAGLIADRPIVKFPFNRIVGWLSLRVARDARVSRSDIVHPGRIENVAARRMRDMFASRPMTAFTADIPLCDLLGLTVVIDRMAAVAQRPRRPLHIVGRI